MLLGSSSFAGLPFSSITNQNNVTITVTKNELSISIGNPGITADSITEVPTGSQVTLGTGTVTLTADANVSPTGSQVVLGTGTVTVSGDANLTAVKNQVVITSGTVTITASADVTPTGSTFVLSTGTAQAITWSEIIPGATMVWTPIDPT